MTRPLILISLCLITSVTGCVYSAPADGFGGTWSSPQLPYEIQFHGPIGIAAQAKTAGLQDGDPVFRLLSLDGTRFTARQLFTDGSWHTVTGERKQDGKLYCSDGVKNWIMEQH